MGQLIFQEDVHVGPRTNSYIFSHYSIDDLLYIIMYIVPYIPLVILLQKVSFCVITHRIGWNDRAVCKRHGDAFNVAWRIAPRAQGRLGRPRPHRARASRARRSSRARTSPSHWLASWATESSEARGSVLLNCSLSYLFKETSTIASILERSEERHWPARLYASWITLPSLSQSERRGNCFLSCLLKSFGTIVWAERNVASLSGPLKSSCICLHVWYIFSSVRVWQPMHVVHH